MYVGKARTLEEWADLYEKKTGEKFKPKNGVLFYLPDRGFASFVAYKDMIIACQVCGDGLFWRHVAEIFAIERGFHHLGAICIRKNIKGYLRTFGWEITKEEILDNKCIFYHFKDKFTKKKGQANPITNAKKGYYYCITWEV